MSDYKTKSVCVYDNGLFIELALKLADSFGQVYYFSPWINSFPKSNQLLVGEGFDRIKRVNYFWDIVDECDLFVFPDVYAGDVQDYLFAQGKRVWGSKHGDELELYRDASKRYLDKIGLAVSPFELITGTTDLRKYLAEHDNQWVKINVTRGDMETFHSKNIKQIEPRIEKLEHDLGAKKHIMTFIVEDAIDDAVETGWDGYCIDGQFPKAGICGIEMKDRAYILITHDESNPMPELITGVNEKLAPVLKNYGYRNFMSTELRVTRDFTPYLIDPCMRCGSPPNELYINMYQNLADIIWNGSEGRLVEPVMTDKYGVELIIHSQWADQEWQTIQFPSYLKDNVKFRNMTFINGEYYVVPQITGLPEIGAVVATGNTLEEAIGLCKEYAEQVESYDLRVFPDELDKAQEEIQKLRDWGIDIDG